MIPDQTVIPPLNWLSGLGEMGAMDEVMDLLDEKYSLPLAVHLALAKLPRESSQEADLPAPVHCDRRDEHGT